MTASDGDKDRPENIVYFLTGQGIDPDRKNDCRLSLIASNNAADPHLLNPVLDLGYIQNPDVLSKKLTVEINFFVQKQPYCCTRKSQPSRPERIASS